MDKVFISSVMRDFAAERTAAKDAVESLGLRALMAESAAASPDASRQALLFEAAIAEADLLQACIAGMKRYEPHSEGLSTRPADAAQRMARRLRDPHQAIGLAALFDVEPDALQAMLLEAYGNVRAQRPNGFPVHMPSLFS